MIIYVIPIKDRCYLGLFVKKSRIGLINNEKLLAKAFGICKIPQSLLT